MEIQWGSFVEPCFFTLTAECSELVDKAVWTKVTLDRLHNTVSPDSRQFHAVKAAELVEVLVVSVAPGEYAERPPGLWAWTADCAGVLLWRCTCTRPCCGPPSPVWSPRVLALNSAGCG